MSDKIPVTLIPGDGIGPEVVDAARRIIEAAGAGIEWEEHEAGAEVFKAGLPSGVPQDTMDSIARTRVALKGPLETPVGFGEKSANVTLRKLYETYANVRPVREMPGVRTPYSGRGIDLVVVRENVEDLYAGIEYMQTPGVAQALKLISVKGSEKIARFAFEYARSEGRTQVACATKANIMKFSEGTMKRAFERVAPDYPEMESWHVIVDNAAHQLVKRPEQFDVLVTTNMNGDILSDLTSALIGGLGFAPSANIGNEVAIFEAVHGSAPKYAGKDVINPTAMILSSVLMLRYLGLFEQASAIEHAVVRDAGVGRADGRRRRLRPRHIDLGLHQRDHRQPGQAHRDMDDPGSQAPGLAGVGRRARLRASASRNVVGLDVFVESPLSAGELGRLAHGAHPGHAAVVEDDQFTRHEGLPTDGRDDRDGRSLPLPVHHQAVPGDLPDEDVNQLLVKISRRHRWMHIEKLQEFDGELGFTRDQGEN